MSDTPRYRLDDLRRFGTGLTTRAGVPPARAAVLAGHLLWFDAAGAPAHGIATLPGWLDRLAGGEFDPAAEGVVTTERGGVAVLDGRGGVPLLTLDRAAGLATEKARETGIALVRVDRLGGAGPAAAVAAEIAVGPFVGAVLGPGPARAVALPTAGGLPAVFDPALADGTRRRGKATPPDLLPGLLAGLLAPGEGCLVAALTVVALEALSSFHERLTDALRGLDEADGRLLPGPWEARRREAQGRGVAVAPGAWSALADWAARLDVAVPEPAANRAGTA